MENVLVSICIPTYNGEKYLRQCLDTCLDQDYKDYEIVICDDGSVDGTIAILEAYARMHSKINFIKNEKNLGLVENWNKCISMAKGKWIKFVFQDDYITKNCLRKFVDEIDETSILLVCERNFILPENADLKTITYYTETVRTLQNTSDFKGKKFSPKLLSTIAMQNMCMNFIGEPSLIFFKKDVISELGYFNKELKQICDFEFALRLGSNYGLTYIPEKLCAFRIHSQTTTNTNVTNNYFDLHYIEPLILSYFFRFENSFKSFRRNIGLLYALKLDLYLKVKSHIAYEAAKKQSKALPLFISGETKFKEIEAIKEGSFFIRFLAKFLLN